MAGVVCIQKASFIFILLLLSSFYFFHFVWACGWSHWTGCLDFPCSSFLYN